MRISIVYDNEALPGLEDGWGFACLVDHPGGRILFDTGGSEEVLAGNMRAMGIDPGSIDTVVISHDHWDHTGGLPAVLHPGLTVYMPASCEKERKREVTDIGTAVEVTGPLRIAEDIFSTGELGSGVREQSLVLRTGHGVAVLTGCAHPGLTEIIEAASEMGTVHVVLGGFHGFERIEELSGMDLIGPCHCTANREKILQRFPDTALDMMAGSVIEL